MGQYGNHNRAPKLKGQSDQHGQLELEIELANTLNGFHNRFDGRYDFSKVTQELRYELSLRWY